LATKTGDGRTVLNIQRKGIPNDRSSYRKTARPKTLCGHNIIRNIIRVSRVDSLSKLRLYIDNKRVYYVYDTTCIYTCSNVY